MRKIKRIENLTDEQASRLEELNKEMEDILGSEMNEGERKVAEFFDMLDIDYDFERPLSLDDNFKPRLWTPDFYLPEFCVYIEVWGTEVRKNKDKIYRQQVYEDNEIPIIYLDAFKKDEKWKRYFILRLKDICSEREEAMKEILEKFNKTSA